ncbi:hypothetical protein GJR96_07095 [Haloferax sp. MBLA0076]|uniref:Uncharacterized protein n=1 Tax=Haloferax litoreum TaxID=2666140 RepID=A0A6A8GG00_9EURY|nr:MULTISPECIES: hypothetical protein [Haloferax]KAB1193222.1 hypothetical protein Hfx1148_07090 [Haloferax sp. CBA1148]MRX21721.1 hypothetical protein [Haloferax litoreum]
MTDRSGVTRRTVLGAVATAGLGSIAGCSGGGDDDSDDATTTIEDGFARELAIRFAPTLYFDEYEQWFPTDPRRYASERDGETIVDGFDAFDGYHARKKETGDAAPDPTVFYNVVQYENSPLAVVQYWFYSAFDQFTTNFHWHDWEVFHVFVDTGEGDERDVEDAVPQLFVASSHSRRVPNNEFLDPDPERVPRILSELGSHSSALSVNDSLDRFQRFPSDGTFADITNSSIERIEDIAEIPIAYGLPRDEGARLPYVVPELDGVPLYDDDRLPSVERTDLVDDALTVRSFDTLSSPPSNLPKRATGLVFDHGERDTDADVTYALVPASDVEHIADFTGPQLSFEFAVPQVAEDAIASHITTTGAPWSQPRYENPAADISEPNHRLALAERYDVISEPSTINTVFVQVTEAVTADDAPDGEGLTTQESTVESVVLLESDPEAVPTFGGIGVVQDVPAGDHRITVNGAGLAPHSEQVSVPEGGDAGDGPVVAGVDGEIPLVARESATKLEVDADGADSELSALGVEDDFAGRLYDTPVTGPDAVYVHRGGAYTVEVRDTEDEVGAFRVNPAPAAESDSGGGVRIGRPNTGKASLATFLADIAEETRTQVESVAARDDSGSDSENDQQDGGGGRANAIQGLAQALAAVAEAARRAAERAEAGNRGRADESLETVTSRIETVAERLAEAQSALPDDLARATDRRLSQARTRSEQAQSAKKL